MSRKSRKERLKYFPEPTIKLGIPDLNPDDFKIITGTEGLAEWEAFWKNEIEKGKVKIGQQ